MALVMQLIQEKIAANRTNQRFIMLEGFCNSAKLENHEDTLQLRFMDELMAVERCIGEVVGVIGLQNEKMSTTFAADRIEEPVIEEEKVAAAKPDGDPENPEDNQEEPDANAAEAAKPKWKHTDYRWTDTNGKTKNLAQLFRDLKGDAAARRAACTDESKDVGGAFFEEKNWKNTGSTSHGDAAVKALDEFCERITEERGKVSLYQ